ncbi:uncharacterized protein LOC119309812 [Triticum dicoccoides]|uniref:uncharacterized protein LOC119309812 n=1 Tax=Triticum dicoccoides TaxID=85692 RepID=UPI0018918D87|nr:uncharacterized protein LOC119309812 [Triticum dicoccoides]
MTKQDVKLDLLWTNVGTKKRNTVLTFLMGADMSTMDEQIKAWYLAEHSLILNQMPSTTTLTPGPSDEATPTLSTEATPTPTSPNTEGNGSWALPRGRFIIDKIAEKMENQEVLLPQDMLADVLGRLAPRDLAISRCVCKAWCTIIDARRLLLADLLPRRVGGIIINFNDLLLSEFFSRPSTGPSVSGNLNYLPSISVVKDHCNGLLLLDGYVVNPATRQWAELPPCPSLGLESFEGEHLVFDPSISPHYEVLVIPISPKLDRDVKLDPAVEELEWPASLCMLHVFSSRTKQWEERRFVREGEAAGTIADMRLARQYYQNRAVYWRGSLYVHLPSHFVMRISLSNNKYQVIKPPKGRSTLFGQDMLYIGKSEKGVYCAPVDNPVRVWILDESCGQLEWVLRHNISLHVDTDESSRPWTLQDVNYYEGYGEDAKDEAIAPQKFDWDSESDNLIDPKSMADDEFPCYTGILGFHPFKEVVFLCVGLQRGLAYHLDSSKVQELGNIFPKCYGTSIGIQPFIKESFIYTPCWMEELP